MPELTPEEAEILRRFAMDTPYQQIERQAEAPLDYDLTAAALGQGKFRDSGRTSEGYGEAIDSVIGAPARRAIAEMQAGNFNKQGLMNTLQAIGSDPRNQPTGFDIASKVTDNPYLGAGLATMVDLGAQLPVPVGAVGKVDDVAAEAKAILSRIKTPEQAVALKGAEREQYLNALDEVYGDRAKRAKDMGFGDKTWYHGSTVDIPAFKNEAKGLSTGAQSAKRGFFFAEDPSTASDYADLAREKGVIREGDNVTTKWMSDTYQEPEKLGYSDYGNKRHELWALQDSALREAERKKSLAYWQKAKEENADWLVKSAERSGQSVDDFIASKTARIQEPIPLATPAQIAEAEAAYYQSLKDFAKGNEPHYAQKILGIDLEGAKGNERQAILDAIKYGEDFNTSTGQNVLPVKLRPGKGKILAKDYADSGYRDESYANLMQKAQDRGNSGVLFKNTYDAADPYNKVLQNIAAVFEPNQIRSTNAAFDPRFKDSDLLLAGKSGLTPTYEQQAMAKAIDERKKRGKEKRD